MIMEYICPGMSGAMFLVGAYVHVRLLFFLLSVETGAQAGIVSTG